MLDRALPALIEGVEDDADAISLLLASLYMRNQLLRDSDWASMDHSLELRVPLVDVALWRTVIGLRRGGQKRTPPARQQGEQSRAFHRGGGSERWLRTFSSPPGRPSTKAAGRAPPDVVAGLPR